MRSSYNRLRIRHTKPALRPRVHGTPWDAHTVPLGARATPEARTALWVHTQWAQRTGDVP